MRTDLEEAFLRAAKQGNKEEIMKTVEAGVDVNICDDSGRNALDKVARTEENNETIKFLLDNGIKVHWFLLTDKRAQLDEEMKTHLGNVLNQQREEQKAELRKKGPKVTFTMQKDGKYISEASVAFPGLDDKLLTVTFAFRRESSFFNGDNLNLSAYINGYWEDGFKIAENEESSRVIDSYVQKGIMPYLKKAKFKSNAASLNNVIAEAQKAVLKKWPDYQKGLQGQADKKKEEKFNASDSLGQKLQDEYGFMFGSEKIQSDAETTQDNNVVTNEAITNKLAVLRKKIAHDIDETLGTHLEEKKFIKPIKKIEKVVSDKLFGKVNE